MSDVILPFDVLTSHNYIAEKVNKQVEGKIRHFKLNLGSKSFKAKECLTKV